MDIIEALKENEKPFGLMSKEMQDETEEIGKINFLVSIANNGGEWVSTAPGNKSLCPSDVYSLRSDYKEEPEVVKVLIHPNSSGCLVYDKADGVGMPWPPISRAVNDPDFIGFLYEDEKIASYPRRYDHPVGMSVITEGDVSNCKVLTPTHVLFKGK
jgi:hypothetical protein